VSAGSAGAKQGAGEFPESENVKLPLMIADDREHPN
jgi:hypothetical protein